jgi:hypothetical protein
MDTRNKNRDCARNRSYLGELAGYPAFRDIRFLLGALARSCIALFLLALFPMVHGQDRQMIISNNRTLIVTSYELAGPVDGTPGNRFYSMVLQKNPFIEIHLKAPLSENRLKRNRLQFTCEEVGVFSDGRSRQTWTIGKNCRLSNAPHH